MWGKKRKKLDNCIIQFTIIYSNIIQMTFRKSHSMFSFCRLKFLEKYYVEISSGVKVSTCTIYSPFLFFGFFDSKAFKEPFSVASGHE